MSVPALIPLIVVAAAVALFVRSPDQVLTSRPLAGTFGYVNAKAAFFVQATFAALMLVQTTMRRGIRAVGILTAIAFAIVPLSSHSYAASATVLLLPALVLSVGRARGIRATAMVGAGIFAVILVATLLLGATYSRDRNAVPRFIGQAVSERRLVLWSDAYDLIRSHPVAGVGLGRFRYESDTARTDPDARWAHNEFLQLGAETGIAGGVLICLMFLWGFKRLSVATGRWSLVALGVGTLTALGVHSCVDYVLHFPVIPIVAAALVGVACARRLPHAERRCLVA